MTSDSSSEQKAIWRDAIKNPRKAARMLFSAAILAAPAATCGAPPPNYCADVKPVITTKCATCHGSPLQNGAPFPLTTYAEVSSHLERIKFRINLEAGQMPPANQPQLTAAEKTLITGWIDKGAPQGTGCQ